MDDYDYLDNDDIDFDSSLDLDNEIDGIGKSIDTYTKEVVKLVGIDDLDEEQKEYAFNSLSVDDHVYARYDFDNDKYEVLKHDHVIGWLPSNFITDREQFFDKVGAIVVNNIHNSLFRKKGIDVTIYFEDENGVESLPYYPIEDRKISVIDTDYWQGEWDEDWYLNIFTDELSYKFPQEFGNCDIYTEISSSVDLRYYIFVTDFLAGRIQNQSELDACIDDLKYDIEDENELAVGKKVLRMRIDSYLAHKEYTIHSYTPKADESILDNDSSFKAFEPHFQVTYVDENGHHENKTINHSNMNVSVVGMRHRENYQQLQNEIKEGTVLTIKHDIANEYDDTAIAFYTKNNELVGYVSRKNKPIVELFLKHGELPATVSFAEDGNVDTNIILQKDDVDLSVIDKYDMAITKINKVKGGSAYVELPEISNIDELIKTLK